MPHQSVWPNCVEAVLEEQSVPHQSEVGVAEQAGSICNQRQWRERERGEGTNNLTDVVIPKVWKHCGTECICTALTAASYEKHVRLSAGEIKFFLEIENLRLFKSCFYCKSISEAYTITQYSIPKTKFVVLKIADMHMHMQTLCVCLRSKAL